MMSNRVTVIGWDNVLLGDDSGFFLFLCIRCMGKPLYHVKMNV